MRPLLLLLAALLASCSSPVEPEPEEPLGVWQAVLRESTAEFYAVATRGSQNIWAAGKDRCTEADGCPGNTAVVFYSTDGGATWKRASLPDAESQYRAIHFSSATDGIALRYNVHRSTDGGASWNEVRKLLTLVITDIEAPTPSTLWASGQARETDRGVVARSVDGGITWEPFSDSSVEGGALFWDVSAPTGRAVYAIRDGLTRTLDGGTTWSLVELPDDPDRFPFAVSFANAETGWIGGDRRRMFRTTNSGGMWERQDIGEGSDAVTAIDALDAENAVAVTSSGAILVTTNGGATWDEQVGPGVYPWLYKVDYDASGYAVAVGFEGIVLRARLR